MSPLLFALALVPSTTWYWQLSGTVNTSPTAQVYDIDLFDNSASMFQQLKVKGHTVVCYFSAGTYENWRQDAKQFPSNTLGSNVSGWPGERWLDIRKKAVRDIMKTRMDLARSKGCDALEADNVDGYSNSNGLGLTAQNQIDYNKFLAQEAHARGMIIALKNASDIVDALADDFDFAVVEQCYAYSECANYKPFIQRNKAVLIAEYSKFSAAKCADAKRNKFSLAFFSQNLNGSKYQPCP